MKRTEMGFGAVFLLFASMCYWSCQKTDHPFGVYAPQGLDVPTATATPLSGAINVFVVENNNAVSGVTVNLKDPNGNYLGDVVTGAYAPFSPFPVTTGTWTAEVYTQGHYLDATQSFEVRGAQTSVTFTAGTVGINTPSLTVSPASQQYQSGNGIFNFGVTYSQPGNLSIPVSVRLVNALPTGFSSAPSTFVLGSLGTGVDYSVVTISKTACFANAVPVTFNAFDFLGNPTLSGGTFTLVRGYQIPLSVSINGTANFSSNITTVNFLVNLATGNDCGYVYPVSIFGVAPNAFNMPQTYYSYGGSLSNGGSISNSFNISLGGASRVNQTNMVVRISEPVGVLIGSVMTSSTYSGVAVNTSY